MARKYNGKRFFPLIVGISLFAIAFSFLQASTAVYLDKISGSKGFRSFPLISTKDIFLNLGFIYLLSKNAALKILQNPTVLLLEEIREAVTFVILVVFAYLTGERWRRKIGIFLYSVGLINISYFFFLKNTIGWPTSLKSKDILFLMPRPVLAFVYVPIIGAVVMVFLGLLLLRKR